MNDLDAHKSDMRANVLGNRMAWRWTIIPQILLFLSLITMLSTVSAYGLYTAINAIHGTGADLKNAVNVFVGGSSSVIGVVVVRLFSKVAELSKVFVHEERRFTSHLVRIGLATTQPELKTVADQYGRR